MFDVVVQFMVQLIHLMPIFIGVYVLFDFIGSFFFNKR